MDKKILSVSIVVFSIIISGVAIGLAITQAQENTIQYPIKELGDCQSKQACMAYCDKPNNIDACLSFAEKNNLMSAKELAAAKQFKKIGMIGPGDCDGKDSCDKYCSNPNNIEECITFAQENDLMSGKELEESQKVLAAIKKGIKPPACGGKEECDVYCSSPDNIEECMAFSIEAGLMPKEEQENAQKMFSAIKQGIKPPACRGEEECQNYCSQDTHIEECIKFGEATGMMNKDDADRMRRTGGKGPGDCKSKTECENFCNTPENQETCMNFGRDNGLIPPEELQKMEQGKQQMTKMFDNMPPEVSQCLNSTLGSEMVNKLKDGSMMPPREIGEKMHTCFESFRPKSPQGEQNGPMQPGQEQGNFGPAQMMRQQIQGGPGGCQGAEECKSYCETHQEECQNFRSPMQPGPLNAQETQNVNNLPIFNNGFKNPEETCANSQNPEECLKSFRQMGPQEGQQGPQRQYQQIQQQQMMPRGEQTEPNEMIRQEGFAPGTAPGTIPQGEMMPLIRPAPVDNVVSPPAEPAPQPVPAPTTLNSNNLFGTIIKPFVKIFGL